MSTLQIDDATHAFLNYEPGMLAVVGSTDRRGYPLLAPVWYRWDGDAILVWTLESRAWVQNVLRDPKVGVSVHGEAEDGVAVIMRGTATVDTSDGSHIDDEIMRITRRYVSEEESSSYISDWPALRSIMRIVPERLFVWGR